MRILILGKDGQLGRALQRVWATAPNITALGRHDLDLVESAQLKATLVRHRPEIILNAAAFTAVDQAESHPSLAHAVNATAPGILAEYSAEQGALLVHFGTDYVFDGRGTHAWTETDGLAPLSVYGATKAEGERRIVATGCRHLILRTSWVYSADGENFLTKILKLSREREGLPVVDDQFGVPTSAKWLAEVTRAAIDDVLKDPKLAGLYHCAPAGETTWNRYARYALQEAKRLGWGSLLVPERIRPVITADYPSPAQRPLNSRLDTHKLRMNFGIVPPNWRDGVREAVVQFVRTNGP